MTSDTLIFRTQLAGFLVLALARFGVTVDEQSMVDLITGLSAIGLLLTAVISKVKQLRTTAEAKRQSGRALPGLLLTLGLVSLFALSLGACSVQPQNSREGLALGYTAHTALSRSVTTATTSGTITVDQAEQAREALAQSLHSLDLAQSLITTNQPSGDALERANDLLYVVEQILLESQP